MISRITTTMEQVIARFIAIHGFTYDYGLVEYIGAHKIVKIICRSHGIFEQTPSDHYGGKGCIKCYHQSRRKTTAEFIREAIIIHGYLYDYSLVEYINAATKVKIICRSHGVFEQLPKNHIHGQGCKKCDNERRTYTTAQYIAKARLIHGDIFDYYKTIYVGALQKVIIICRIHGDFNIKASHHLEGQGCVRCSWNDRMYSTEEYIMEATIVHNGFYSYAKTIYISSEHLITIICPKHGEFEQQAYVHLYGHGCQKCARYNKNGSVSNIETSWLDHLLIPKEYRQHTIKLHNKSYIVDAYDPITNTIYEFYGDFWHGNPLLFIANDIHPIIKISYGDLYNRTVERELLCRNAGYNIVSIWENDWKALIRKAS